MASALVNSLAFEALSFIGVHGKAGLLMRDLVFFLEHAAIPSRPHLWCVAEVAMDQYEMERGKLVAGVLRCVCATSQGVALLEAPSALTEGSAVVDGFPEAFLDRLFTSASPSDLFSVIKVAPTEALSWRILGISCTLSANCLEVLNLVLETRGEGVRKTELHKQVSGSHHAALIDLESSLHIVEVTRYIDEELGLTEDRIVLSFLSQRQSVQRLRRVQSTLWGDIIHECAGMPPAFVLRQKILWTFAALAIFAAKNKSAPFGYISHEEVAAMKVQVPRIMCLEDIMPYAPDALAEFPMQMCTITRLIDRCVGRAYGVVIGKNRRGVFKGLRKTFENHLPPFGLTVVHVPLSYLASKASSGAEFEDDEDDDGPVTAVSRGERYRILCAFVDSSVYVELNQSLIGAGAASAELAHFYATHNGKTPKQIIDQQAKTVTMDLRRPLSSQLVETVYHSRPILMSGFVPLIHREEKKHGLGRWWRHMSLYPSLERMSHREIGSKTAETMVENPARDALAPITSVPFLRYAISASVHPSSFDDEAAWEDDVAEEYDSDREYDSDGDGDLDEYWLMSAPDVGQAAEAPSYQPPLGLQVSNGTYGSAANNSVTTTAAAVDSFSASPSSAKPTHRSVVLPTAAEKQGKEVALAEKRASDDVKGGEGVKVKAEEEEDSEAKRPTTDAEKAAEENRESVVESTPLPTNPAPLGSEQLPQLAAPAPAPVSSAAVATPAAPSQYITVTPQLIETEEQLAQRMLQFIRDNTLIPGKNVVTTEQLSVVFYRSQIKTTLERLAATTPPTIATTSIHATNKKIVGAIYFYGESYAPNEIQDATRAYNRAASRRIHIFDTNTTHNSNSNSKSGASSSKAPVGLLADQKPTRTAPYAAVAAVGNPIAAVSRASRNVTAAALRKPETLSAVATTGRDNKESSRLAVGTLRMGRTYGFSKGQYWKVRNGWESNIHRRCLRLHLELWRLCLRMVQKSNSAGATVAVPDLPLSVLQRRMALSTYSICFGIAMDLAAICPPNADEVQWDLQVDEVRNAEFCELLFNCRVFTAAVLPMLFVMASRNVLQTTPPLTEELVAKAASLSLDQGHCTQLMSGLTIQLNVRVRRASVLAGAAEDFLLAPEVELPPAAALIAPHTPRPMFVLPHPSVIAKNVLDLWYTTWAADLEADGTRKATTVIKRLKTEDIVRAIADTLAKRAANAEKALAEANGARVIQANTGQMALDRELMRMPKKKGAKKRGRNDDDGFSSASSGSSSGDSTSSSDDSDAQYSLDSDDSDADDEAIREGRVRFRREGFINDLVNEGTPLSPSAAQLGGGGGGGDGSSTSTVVVPLTRRGGHLGQHEKEQLALIAAMRFPTATQVVALSRLLGISVAQLTENFFRRPPLLSIGAGKGPHAGGGGGKGRGASRNGAADGDAEAKKAEAVLQSSLKRCLASEDGTRQVIPAANASKAIMLAATTSEGRSPIELASAMGSFYRGVLPDALFTLVTNLQRKAARRRGATSWDDVIRTLRGVLMNVVRVEARRIMDAKGMCAAGLLSAEAAAAEEEEVTRRFKLQRRELSVSSLAPTVGRLLGVGLGNANNNNNNNATAGDRSSAASALSPTAVITHRYADLLRLERGASSDAEFARNKTTKVIEDEIIDAAQFPEEEVESTAELMRMIVMSDKAHFLPVVSKVAQNRISENLLRKAARRKLPLLTHPKGVVGRRLVCALVPSSCQSVLPREYGVDPLLDEAGAADGSVGAGSGGAGVGAAAGGEEALDLQSRSGRGTRRCAHAFFNFVMQSSWTGNIADITSVVPEAFGDSSRYQLPLRTTMDHRQAAELLWSQLTKSLGENAARAEEKEDEELHLPTNYVVVDATAPRASLGAFVGLAPSFVPSESTNATPAIAEDEDDTATWSAGARARAEEDDNAYSGSLWNLPRSEGTAADASAACTDEASAPCPSRALAMSLPTVFSRQVACNTSLFSCPIDPQPPKCATLEEAAAEEARRLQVPHRGSLSVFRHLDGTPNTFLVAACVSKVFDIILRAPGVLRERLLRQVADDSSGLWTEWHTDAALRYLLRAQYVAASGLDTTANNSCSPPWDASHDARDDSLAQLLDPIAATMAEASPFGEEVLAIRGGCCYTATLHGVSQYNFSLGVPIHPAGSLLQR